MLRFPVPFLALTFAMAIVAATHPSYGPCDSRGAPALGIVELTTGDPRATFYVDDRNLVMGNGLWIYKETNGVWTDQGAGIHTGDVTNHNLQRRDWPGEAYSGEPCWDYTVEDPDSSVF